MATERKNRGQNAASKYVTQRDLMLPSKKKRADLLFLGVLLILAGLIFFAAVSGMVLAKWVLGLWPLFSLIIGVAAVMGYAVERKPRSPIGGMLLIFVGVIFGAARLHSDLNAIQIYGRYWLLLLIVFAAVELVRYYSRRQNEAPPRLFSVGRILFVLFLAGSGVLASRVTTNDSVLASLKLPWFLNNLRDAVIGEKYSFTDEPVTIADLKPNSQVVINNSYGDVKIIGGATTARATLTQGISSWSREEAQKVADQLNIVVTKTSEGEFNITTNRNEVNYREFRTDLQLELPGTVVISVVNSYGTVKANNLQNGLTIKSSYEGGADVKDIVGNTVFNMSYADVNAVNVQGNVTITNAKNVSLNNVSGDVEVGGNRGTIDLRQIAGAVKVDAPYSRITAQDLKESANLQTQHGSVRVTHAADVKINAPHSDIIATDINGNLEVASSHGDIKASKVSGNFTVDATQSNVSAEEIQSEVNIETTHGEVAVKNFHEGVQVKTSFENVLLMSSGQVVDDIDVENSHGEIKLILQQATNFKLDAESRNGQVNANGLMQIQQKDRSSLSAVSGDGGPTIKLRTSYRPIFVQANGLRQIQTPGSVKPLTF